MPIRVSRHARGIEVGLLVAAGTTHCRQAMTIRAPCDRRLVPTALFSLAWVVAGWMAVDAARMRQHFSELREHCRGSRRCVGDRREALGCREAVRLLANRVRD